MRWATRSTSPRSRRSLEQFDRVAPKGIGERDKQSHVRVGPSGLYPLDLSHRQVDALRELLLRQPSRLTQLCQSEPQPLQLFAGALGWQRPNERTAGERITRRGMSGIFEKEPITKRCGLTKSHHGPLCPSQAHHRGVSILGSP
jgi:hypothetical protein